jgi:peroxiredoxin
MQEERSVNERTGLVIFGGKPATLLGDELEVGEAAPDFTAAMT